MKTYVHYDGEIMMVDAVGGDGEWTNEGFNCGHIDHWMPLLKPPKGE